MRLKKLKLHNFRCFEDLEVEFHDNLTVIVGVNGSGKTSIMEGAAVAVGTMFVAFDGLASRRIYKSDAQIKAFPIGSAEDIQAQYPVDIAYRMAILNPQLLEKVLSDTEGIILIDEIDLHLHPSWQQRVIRDLTSIFPKVQFIVSTHAPAIINSVQSENLFVLKNHQIIQLDNWVYGKDVKSV